MKFQVVKSREFINLYSSVGVTNNLLAGCLLDHNKGRRFTRKRKYQKNTVCSCHDDNLVSRHFFHRHIEPIQWKKLL